MLYTNEDLIPLIEDLNQGSSYRGIPLDIGSMYQSDMGPV